MHGLHRTRVDHFDAHLPLDSPERVQTRLENLREPVVNPDQRPLVVMQIDDDRFVAELARLHDDVEILVHQPRIPCRHDLKPQLQERIEVPVHTRPQNSDQRAFAPQESPIVDLDFDSMDHWYLLSLPAAERCRLCSRGLQTVLRNRPRIASANATPSKRSVRRPGVRKSFDRTNTVAMLPAVRRCKASSRACHSWRHGGQSRLLSAVGDHLRRSVVFKQRV